MSNDLQENVFPLTYPPTKEQANNKGNVLFYAKGHGWYMGWFYRPHMEHTTHWTYAPDDLNIPIDSDETTNLAFKAWLKQYPKDCFGAESMALMKMGFLGGWRRGQP
jgi:hypothetical protein